MKKKYSLFIVLLLLISCTLKEEIDLLPKPTHEGALSLGYLINERPVFCKGKIILLLFGGSSSGVNISFNNDSVHIYSASGYHENLSFNIHHFYGTGQYSLTDKMQVSSLHYYNQNDQIDLYSDSLSQGYINVTYYNKNKKIIAGNFDFTLQDAQGKPYHFSKGQFDLLYN